MLEFLSKLFDTSDYMPRAICGTWTRGEIALHNGSDFLIWTAYLAIPIVLFTIAARRGAKLPFGKILWLFGLFIIACGTTHFLDIVLFYAPVYRLAGVVKLITALASWATVIVLAPMLPILLAMRTPGELEREIAERHRVEAELRASEARFVAFMDNNPALVSIKDDKGHYLYVNRTFRETFAERTDDWIGKTDFEIWPEVAPAVRATEEAVLQQGNPQQMLEILPAKDGEREWMSFKFPLPSATGEPLIGGVSLDVTGQQRAARLMVDINEKLERSNRDLQDFAYIASHDLQEPLRKIQVFGGRLNDHCADQLDERGRDYLSRMQNAATRMQTLVNDLLELSRIATTARPFEPVDLNQIAAEVMGDLENLVHRTGGKVEIGPLPTVRADARQMQQLIQNLVGNALKFHRPDVAPVVKLESAEPISAGVAPENAGHFQGLVVEDNGIGIEQTYLERIFHPFQRLHGRNEYEGTGIGLAICRKIIERHGGQIRVESKP